MLEKTGATAENPIRVLIVDDHPVVREGLNAMVCLEPDMQIVGEATNGTEAIDLFHRLKPNIIVMDLILPDVRGTEAIEKICKESSDVGLIVLTSACGDEEVYRAFDAGARGFLFKDMARKELAEAIRAVSKGRRHASGSVGKRLAETLPRTDLSKREVEVLQRIAVGRKNKEIAFELGISEATVNAHVKHMLQKLGAGDRTEAVTTALGRGIIRL
jgi:DNA-binding NarL/FixJ family response regulator